MAGPHPVPIWMKQGGVVGGGVVVVGWLTCTPHNFLVWKLTSHPGIDATVYRALQPPLKTKISACLDSYRICNGRNELKFETVRSSLRQHGRIQNYYPAGSNGKLLQVPIFEKRSIMFNVVSKARFSAAVSHLLDCISIFQKSQPNIYSVKRTSYSIMVVVQGTGVCSGNPSLIWLAGCE